MQLIVVGAGAVGAALVDQALEGHHEVTLIEVDAAVAQEMSERLDARVLHGNIADGEIFESAAPADADAIVATTDDDAANLMAMVLGREAEIPTLVSVVKDARHRHLFQRLGVHVLLDPEAIVAQYLYGILCRPEVDDSVALPGGGFALDLELHEDAGLVGRTPSEAWEDARLPREVAIVWVRSGDGRAERPDPERRFEAGDRLTVFAPEPLHDDALRAFGSKRGP